MHLSIVTHTCSFYKVLSTTAPVSEEVRAYGSSRINVARYASKLGSCLTFWRRIFLQILAHSVFKM